MLHLAGDLRERRENKGALVHGGVRQGEVGVVEDEPVAVAVFVEEQVEVDDAGAFGWNVGGAKAAHGGFDVEQPAHEVERVEVGFEQCGGVGEAGLVAVADRVGGVKAGNGRDAAEIGKAVEALMQIRDGIPEPRWKVGAEGDRREHLSRVLSCGRVMKACMRMAVQSGDSLRERSSGQFKERISIC